MADVANGDWAMQGSATKLEDIKRYEVTEVYNHPDAKVDIVLVHGLNGNPRNTWTAPNGVFWPSQLLPASLKSFQARILVYGYNADVYTFGNKGGGPRYVTEHNSFTSADPYIVQIQSSSMRKPYWRTWLWNERARRSRSIPSSG